ncbi:MAG: hypothetical protein JWQ14_2859 [Adhaeribacter sp.]|nr:hypothetical protein [Adhaeribacter sp.]
MKPACSLILFLLFFNSFSAAAQSHENLSTQPEKFYVGVNYSNTQYFLEPKNFSRVDATHYPNFITYPGIHVGYMLGKRASIQIGVAYAHEKWQIGSEYNNAGIIEGSYDSIFTRGGIIPISFRYNFLNIGKRFHVYGTSSLTAAYGKTTLNHNSTVNEEVTDSYQKNKSALNMYLSLGLGLNYNIGERVGVFGELLLLNKNLSSGYKNQTNTINVGFNYKFK